MIPEDGSSPVDGLFEKVTFPVRCKKEYSCRTGAEIIPAGMKSRYKVFEIHMTELPFFEDLIQGQCEQKLRAGEEIQGAMLDKQGLQSPSEVSEISPKWNGKPLKGCKPKSDLVKCII